MPLEDFMDGAPVVELFGKEAKVAKVSQFDLENLTLKLDGPAISYLSAEIPTAVSTPVASKCRVGMLPLRRSKPGRPDGLRRGADYTIGADLFKFAQVAGIQ